MVKDKKIKSSCKSSTSPSPTPMAKKKYKGVRMRSWGSWVSEIRAPYQKARIWLGSYSTPEAAARAYDAALLCLKGPNADFNFPASTLPSWPTDTVMSPKSIQKIAAAAAAAPESGSKEFPVARTSTVSSPGESSEGDHAVFESCSVSTQNGCNGVQEVRSWLDDLEVEDVGSTKCGEALVNASLDPFWFEDIYGYEEFGLWNFC